MSVTSFIVRKLINYQSEESFAFRLRKKRAGRIMGLIDECYIEHKKVNIIDIGGTQTYWKIIPREYLLNKKVHITVVNLPASSPLPENDELFTFLDGDGCNLVNFSDKFFQIAHSNSVIEHVGSWDNMINFANEIKRVAEKYYIQTPNFWFPIEPHFVTPFFHWLPKSIRIKMLMNFNLGWYKKIQNYNEAIIMIDGCSLLSKNKLLKLFPDATFHKEKFFFLVKSNILIKT